MASLLPNNPMMLLSVVNTQLRDEFSSLDELCIFFNADRDDIEEKLSAISYLRKSLGKGETLFCVGDGFHDADIFECADVGIALNAMGGDRAERAADVILMDDDIQRIPVVMKIVTGVSRLLMENVILLSAAKLFLLILALLGLISILPAALLHTLVVCLASVNALRSYSVE